MNLSRFGQLLVSLAALLIVFGCSSQRSTSPLPSGLTQTSPAGATSSPASGSQPPSAGVPSTASPSGTAAAGDTPAASSGSPEPIDSGGGTTTGGDIPDNAVFLTYHDTTHAFSIQYVEGWQVTPGTDGVVIRDKDSSETVQVVPPVSDIAAYIASTDLPQLQTLPGFQLDKQDLVNVNGAQINHLAYRAPSPPDPVTGKQVASLIDRYYVPGPNGLAIVTLSTPEGVDNVDAFRLMIKSFVWG